MYNQYKESIRDIIKQLCGYKGVEILEGHLMSDHIHMLVSIPPKLSISQFMGYDIVKITDLLHKYSYYFLRLHTPLFFLPSGMPRSPFSGTMPVFLT